MIGRIESGESIPTLHASARLVPGAGNGFSDGEIAGFACKAALNEASPLISMP